MKNYTPSSSYKSSLLLGENATKWDEDTETWVPTSIYDNENEEWVLNEDILSPEEMRTFTVTSPEYC